MRTKVLRKRLLLITIFLVALCACEEGSDSSVEASGSQGSSLNVNLYKLNKLVCDPFEGGDETDLNGGVAAELFYRKDGQERFYSAERYMSEGERSDSHIFFSQIFVPTRRFELGFPTETGEILKTNEGSDLVEYFGLRFKTFLSLDETQDEGLYEIALLSDDGTVLKVYDEQDNPTTLIDNDGDHPTRMGCAQNLVYFSKNTRVPITIDYYQGPRYHISIVPMWRKVTESDSAEPHCGTQGNSRFFDYNNNSEPQQAYQDLLSRGWRPWNAKNHKLPKEYKHNPCTQGEPPVISNFTISTQPGGLIAQWETDIEATAQLRIVKVSTGEEVITDSDNVLRTTHSVQYSGLEAGVQYSVQAVSISATYGKALSDPKNVIIEF